VFRAHLVRLVSDPNVVVAGIVAEGLCREILERHVPEHDVILSQVLWDELVVTLRRKFRLTPDDLPILALYRKHATWCEPATLAESVCRDPDDDWVLATALAGDADAIVSGDADLLTLDRYSGIEMLSPRQFVSRQMRPPRR
jgi:putative PIN family toxin of toxin-antitoxin system